MQLAQHAHSYSTPANAIKQLDKVLAAIGRSRENTHWFIIAQDGGRFSPAVQSTEDNRWQLIQLAHHKIVVV